ncbi:SGNH/GDSL hydrolase family protein [Dactylosporangium darangshiense]|uniref:LLM class flavin-dependent oxidoreductase n=1 Tax=Dactylosporangium darangshiense TaxID=579108 RepID=A0ABP8DS77_9ACTN
MGHNITALILPAPCDEEAASAVDEFDEAGLGRHRQTPEEIERYADICEELGL